MRKKRKITKLELEEKFRQREREEQKEIEMCGLVC